MPAWSLRHIDDDDDDDGGPVALQPPGPYRLGRRSGCDVVVDDERASRDHAIIEWVGEASRESDPVAAPPGASLESPCPWRLSDLASRHGTWLNGVRLAPHRAVPLHHGDVISIASRTFRLVDGSAASKGSTVRLGSRAGDAAEEQSISRLDSDRSASDVRRRLALLVSCAESLRRAESESALAEAVLDAAAAAVAAPNMAMLRAAEHGRDDTEVEVLAHRGDILAQGGLHLSRTLLRRAAGGEAVRLIRGAGSAAEAQSVLRLDITQAVCVPLFLGPSVAAYLYFDHRGRPGGLTDESAEFIIGLGRMASLALADLKRRELERRQALVEAELAAAGEVHRWILPPRAGGVGSLHYVGESRPGPSAVGGDFFDVIELPGGRLAVALGDVSGKGIAASVLMTSVQGFLHAAIRQHLDPARAVTDLNDYVALRRRAGRFVTLWVGVFDANRGELDYVDAGHGLAVLLDPREAPRLLREGGGPPIGVDLDFTYSSSACSLRPGGQALIVSDGVVEQRSAPPHPRPFGLEAVLTLAWHSAHPADPVGAIFQALHEHAGCDRLDDDATAILVRW